MSETKITKVIIPCAGYGTRLLPSSKCIAKEMFPIVNKPGIERIISEMDESNMTTIVLITSKNKSALVDHFDKNSELEHFLASKNKTELLNSITKFRHLNFVNVRQSEALGLGHAVFMGKATLNRGEPFVVALPDMLIDGSTCIKQMCQLAQSTGKAIIALMRVQQKEVSSYGIVDGYFDKDNVFNVQNLLEKPAIHEAPTTLAVLGRYILPYRIIDILEHVKPDQSGEIQLTSALQVLAKENNVLGVVVDDQVHDIGCVAGFIEANLYYGLQEPKYKDQLVDYCKELLTKV